MYDRINIFTPLLNRIFSLVLPKPASVFGFFNFRFSLLLAVRFSVLQSVLFLTVLLHFSGKIRSLKGCVAGFLRYCLTKLLLLFFNYYYYYVLPTTAGR